MGKKFSVKSIGKWLSENIIIVLIFLASVFVSTQNKNFLSANNIRNLLSNTAVRFIIACGVSGCLITKGTDLSAGRVAGLAACLSGILMQRANYDQRFYPGMPEMPLFVVLLIVVALCALIGAVNGSVIAFLKVPPFIATLGTLSIFRSLALYMADAGTLSSNNDIFRSIGYCAPFGIPLATICFLVLAVLFVVLLNQTPFGRHVCAAGANPKAARYAAIRLNWVRFGTYALAGLSAGIAAFLFSTRLNSISSTDAGMSYELDAIAGAIIGGTAMNGGRGAIAGTAALTCSEESLAEERMISSFGSLLSSSFFACSAHQTTPPVQPWSALGMETPTRIFPSAGFPQDVRNSAAAEQTTAAAIAKHFFMIRSPFRHYCTKIPLKKQATCCMDKPL